MISIGSDELARKESIGDEIRCNQCGENHPIEYGDSVLEDGTTEPSKMLAFYRCGDKAYLAGIAGKAL